MNWTTALIDLEDDQVRTRNTELNGFTIRGGYSSHKSIKQSIDITLIATVFSCCFSNPLLMGDLLHYISHFGPS